MGSISIFRRLWMIIPFIAHVFAPHDHVDNMHQPYVTVEPGVGYREFRVGYTQWAEIEQKLGRDYVEIHHDSNNVEMRYSQTGTSFFYCQNDSDKTISAIRFTAPFMAKTMNGIHMYETPIHELIKKYGNPHRSTAKELTWTYGYYGVNFLVADIQLPSDNSKPHDKRIIAITINNNCDCNTNSYN